MYACLGGTWKRLIVAAALFGMLSVAPAMLILRYVLDLDYAIVIGVLTGMSTYFLMSRKTLCAYGDRFQSIIRDIFTSGTGEEDRNNAQKPIDVGLDIEDVGIIFMLMFWTAFASGILAGDALSREIDIRLTFNDLLKFPGYLIAFYVFHEALHGLAALCWGKIPIQSLHFGIFRRWVALYCHVDRPMTVGVYRVFALLPLIVTTPAAGLILWWDPAIWSLLLFSLTFCGCAGDVLLFFKVRRFENDRYVHDHPSELGFRILPADKCADTG